MENEECLCWRSRLWGFDFFRCNAGLRLVTFFLLISAVSSCNGHPIQPEDGTYKCSKQSQVSEVECWALVALQEALGGPDEPEGWLADTTPCSWSGVTCEAGSVEELDLEGNLFTGSIPPELGNLANLQHLDLSVNQLTGPIPPELGNLAGLRHLWLYNNQLTGSIPPEMGNLASLETLDLHHNLFTGSIPPELGNLANLQHLDLTFNQLTGPIPPELDNLAGLRDLWLYSNQLAGSIPPELGNLADLQQLWLGLNQLTGSIPPELGNLANLQYLDLKSNQLTGLVPLSVAQRGGVIQSLYSTDWCVLLPPGNGGLYMPDTQEYRNADLDDDALICGLGFTTGLTSTASAPGRREVEGFWSPAG